MNGRGVAGEGGNRDGGSRGIGRNVCLSLPQQGASVVLCYQGNASAASEVLSLIHQQHHSAIAVQADVSIASDVAAIFNAAISSFGHVNIVIHLAGILLSSYPSLENTSLDDWQRTLSVNATGTFLICQEAAKHVSPGGMGRIITTSSSMVHTLTPGFGAYVASKAAVEALTKMLAKELKGRKITANCVAPGPVATDMFFAGKSEATIEAVRQAPPLQRLGVPEDIVPLIMFLVGDKGEWVNGQIVRINGGSAI